MPFGGVLRLPPALALLLAARAGGSSAGGDLWAAAQHLRQHGVTDHTRHAAAEQLAAELAGSSVQQPLGQPREVAPLQQAQAESTPAVLASSKPPTWRLTAEGVPCQIPFTFEGVSYEDCHPAGWCCLDPSCARRAACVKPGQGSDGPASAWEPLPLVHPRDEPRTACSLPAVGETGFRWQPGNFTGSDATTVFMLLDADASEPWEEDFSPLLELAEAPVNFVWLSYATGADKVERLMLQMQSRLREAVRNSTARAGQDGHLRASSGRGQRAEALESKFFFVRTPAWHIPLSSCWLPSAIYAWSYTSPVLSVPSLGGGPQGFRTAANGVKGAWAPSWEADAGRVVVGPLRWFGLACGEHEDSPADGIPAPPQELQGAVALVQRGQCSFYQKVRRAQDAGASAVVIFSYGDSPITMGCAAPDPCDTALNISAVMVSRSHGLQLLEGLNASSQELVVQLAGERRGPAHVALRGGGGGIRALGSLRQGLESVAREALGLERERRLAARRADMEARAAAGDGAALVKVFEREHLAGSLVAPWPAERAAALQDQQYDSLELELWLDCEDHLDKNCGPWDFEIDLYVCGPDNNECRDRAANIGRWITPYGREARWLSNATAALPLLLQAGANGTLQPSFLHMRSNWWQAYTVTLTLWFHRAAPAAARGPALLRVPLWRGGRFNEGYNVAHLPHDFSVPAGSSRAILSVLLSGHGWGIEEANCAEFCNHTHHFQVNGREEIVKAYPDAGTGDACGALVAEGVVPNQYGTWTFGRAGWCPGMPVRWWEVDVTQLLLHGSAPNNITYRALFNGTDYVPVPASDANPNGYAAEIHLASSLTFYGSASPRAGPANEPSARAGRKQPILLL